MKTLLRNLGNVLYLLRPYWKYGKLLMLLSLFNAVALSPVGTLAAVTVTQVVIDALIDGKALGAIVGLAALRISVLVGVSLLQRAYLLLYVNKKTAEIELQIARDIYARALRTDYRYFDDPKFYSDYTWAVHEYAAKSAEARSLILAVCGALATIASLAALIAALGPLVLAIAAATFTLYTLQSMRQNKISLKMGEELLPQIRRAQYAHRVFYLRTNAADLKATDVGRHLLGMYDRAGAAKIGVLRKHAPILLLWQALGNVIVEYGQLPIIAYIAYGVLDGRIASVGAYAGLIAAEGRMSQQMAALADTVSKVNLLSLYAEKIRVFFELKSEIEPPAPDARPAPEGALSVELRGARFAYANSGFAIRDFNIKIAPGEKIAVVGENGAGKSTLMKLLLRLYDLDSGEILINGAPIGEYDVRGLRRRVGVAFQTPNLYAIPLAENMQTYNHADEARLREILTAIGLDGALEKAGATLETEVTKEFSKDGVMLSGGEAQKLGLARVLVGDFGLLLLDEPSSALDPLAEYELTRLIFARANSATTVMVAHRLSTVRDADRIILVDGGAVRETGTHDELMALGGKYCETFTKQAENYVK